VCYTNRFTLALKKLPIKHGAVKSLDLHPQKVEDIEHNCNSLYVGLSKVDGSINLCVHGRTYSHGSSK
jgi:hypothetical protein